MKMKKGLLKALFFILIAFFAVRFVSFEQSQTTNVSPLAKNIVKATSKPTPSMAPTTAPTPTPVPTPTPTPIPTGYCLNVPVLFYHHIQPQADAVANKQTSVSTDINYFEQQLAYLNDNKYVSISALDLVNALKNHAGLPGKSVVVTIDDGYSDVYTNVFPLIKRYTIRVSLLIPSGLIGNAGYLTWDQLNDMKNSGLVYLIDHSWSHYSLPAGSTEKIKYEVETAKSQIEQYTGQKVELFGYPYGVFDNRTIQVLNEDGFLGAFTTLPGAYQCDSFIMALHRTRIGNSSLSYYGL